MEIAAGDIIRCDTAIADHAKYHICILECGEDGRAACFLFLNSKTKTEYKGDLIFDNDDFPCIPFSKTGQSIVSLSAIVRYNAKQLKLFRAKIIGRLSPIIARKIEAFARTVPTLTSQERKIVLAGLAKIK